MPPRSERLKLISASAAAMDWLEVTRKEASAREIAQSFMLAFLKQAEDHPLEHLQAGVTDQATSHGDLLTAGLPKAAIGNLAPVT